MKSLLLVLFALPVLLAAKPFKNEKLNPAVEEPVMPGTSESLEEFNTAPNETPEDNQTDTFRGSTVIEKQTDNSDEEKSSELNPRRKK